MITLRKIIEEYNKKFELLKLQASTDEERRRINRTHVRWLCHNDLWYLGKITGHTKFVDPFHKDLCDMVSLMNWQIVHKGIMPKPEWLLPVEEVVTDPQDLGKMQRLFLLFRSAFKTTIITKLHTVQLLLNFPDIHIAISHNTQINASENLTSVKNLFLTTELKDLFPEYIPSTKDWGNQTGFSVACRKAFNMNGDNVEAIGINTEVTGRKYHIFKNDDIVTDKSVTNEEQLRQSRDFLELHKSLFVNPSIRVEDYAGTKYHFADAYSTLEENPNVETMIVKLLYEDDKGDILWKGRKHTCIVPELYSKDGIEGLMSDEYIFNCQYQLHPEDPKKIKFTREMIQYFNYIPEGLNYYLIVDPADSEEKRACYTAMKVIGIDHDENWYWVDGAFDKLDDRERIDTAVELAEKWKVFEVLWEHISFGRTDCRNLERRRREIRGATWQVREIKANRQSKDDRILGLNDRYSRRKIFWAPKMMYYSKFEGKAIDIIKAQEYEFLGFPLVSHKDLLDAESFLLQLDTIKGDRIEPKNVSKYAHISDPVKRGVTEVFWHEWDKWKENNFRDPVEAYSGDNLDLW